MRLANLQETLHAKGSGRPGNTRHESRCGSRTRHGMWITTGPARGTASPTAATRLTVLPRVNPVACPCYRDLVDILAERYLAALTAKQSWCCVLRSRVQSAAGTRANRSPRESVTVAVIGSLPDVVCSDTPVPDPEPENDDATRECLVGEPARQETGCEGSAHDQHHCEHQQSVRTAPLAHLAPTWEPSRLCLFPRPGLSGSGFRASSHE
jgi:hypothetical protein